MLPNEIRSTVEKHCGVKYVPVVSDAIQRLQLEQGGNFTVEDVYRLSEIGERQYDEKEAVYDGQTPKNERVTSMVKAIKEKL